MARQRANLYSIGVLGGTGFLGRHLAAHLVRLGYAIVVPTRLPQRAQRLRVLPRLELRQTDVNDPDAMRAALAGCDAVVNLIGILNERGHKGFGFQRAHVELTSKLVAACHEVGIGRIVQVSALKANAERGPSHYLKSKGQAEEVLRTQCEGRIAYTIFRPSVIFGPDDSFLNRFASLLRLSPVLPLARAGAQFAPVYVGDVVTAIATALADDRTHGKTYELCGPESYTLQEIVGLTRQLLGIRRLVVPLPDWLGRLQAAVCDYVIPGKPFSLDNFRSLTVASLCGTDGLGQLGLPKHSLRTLAPKYFGAATHQRALAQFRRRAGR